MAGAVMSVLAAAVLWGTVGHAQIWADTGAHPVSLGAARMLLAGLVLSLLTVRPAAGSTTLDAAEEASRTVCGFSEIERERRRAAHPDAVGASQAPGATPAAGAVRARFAAWERATLAEGIEYVTSRRITKELELAPTEARLLLDELRTGSPVRRAAPLWKPAPDRIPEPA